MTFGQRLKAERDKKNWSQDTLAEKIGVKSGKQTIGKWERDQGEPALQELKKLAEVFGITVGQLVDGEEATLTSEPKAGYITVPMEEFIDLQRRVIRLQDEEKKLETGKE